MCAPQEIAPLTTTAGLAWIGLARFIPLAVIAIVVAIIYAMGGHRALSLEVLVDNRATIDAFITGHGLVALLVYVGLYGVSTACALPAGPLLAVAGGFLFGSFFGGLGAMLGSTMGASILYLLARSAFREQIMRAAGPLLQAFAAGFRADAFSYVLFLRLVPSPSWLTSVAAGSFGVRPITFVAATVLGRVPGSFVFALFGSGFGSVLATQEVAYRACLTAAGSDCHISFNPADVLTPAVLAGFAGLAVLALAPALARRLVMPHWGA